MLTELLEQNHRQQVRPGPSPRRGMEGCWRLADLLAGPARELLANGLDHLPLPGDDLERLGDVLAHLHDAVRATARTGRRWLDHHTLTRQVLGERFTRRAAALEPDDRRGLRLPSGNLVLGGRGLEFLELQLHLVDQAGTAFGTMAVVVAPELGDLELEMLDHRLGGRDHRPGLRQLALGDRGTSLRRRQGSAQSGNLGSGIGHAKSIPRAGETPDKIWAFANYYPAFVGRCVHRGLRQSIPSRR